MIWFLVLPKFGPLMLVAEFSLSEVAEFLLSSRNDDTRSRDNFLVYFSMPCQPEGLGIHIYRLLASQAYAKMLASPKCCPRC